MIPPKIAQSTKEERLAFVESEWECMHHCESCGKCHILKNHDATSVYDDYINGNREYMDITLEIRRW